MRLQRLSDRQMIQLDTDAEIGAGGEARVFALSGDERVVAKVYRKIKPLYTRKLAIQLANPPDNPTAAEGHLSFAWPTDLLIDPAVHQRKARVAGFLMPRVTGMRPLIDFYNPKTRRTQCPLFNYLYLHRTARNLAAAVSALHTRGYAIGDVNESNILLTDTALVTLVDIDSIQVRDPDTGEVYRCPVGKAEFTPPELQGQSFANLDRSAEHDLFGLAVLIFQLLMEGTHPFAGVYKLPGDPPPMEKRIAEGFFPYGTKRVPVTPMPVAPPFQILHPTLQNLFIRCFEEGYLNPGVRPDARTWVGALKLAEDSLKTCGKNDQHRYSSHLSRCPWCDRTSALGGRDPFPSREAVQRGHHLKPIPPKKIPVLPAPSALKFPAPQSAKYPVAVGGSQFSPSPVPSPYASSTYQTRSAPLLEFSLPPVNPLLAGLFILSVALGGIVYGNTSPKTPVAPSVPQTAEIRTPALQVSLVQTINAQVPINAIAVSPDGRSFATNSANGTVTLWNLATAQPLRILKETTNPSTPSLVNAIAMSPNGKLLVSASRSDDFIKVWDFASGNLLRTLQPQKGVVSLAIAPNKQILATGSRDRTLRLWNLENGNSLRTFGGWNAGWVNAIAITPTEQTLVAGTDSGKIYRIHLDTLQEQPPLRTIDLPVEAMTLSPDGKTLASSQSQQIYLWDLSQGKLNGSLSGENGHNDIVRAIAISPDGRYLASGSADKTIKLWDLDEQKWLGTLNKHEDEVLAVAFSPDGKTLITGSSDRTIKLWQINK